MGPCVIRLSVPPGHAHARTAALEAGFRALIGSEGAPELRKIAIGGVVTPANWHQVGQRLRTLLDVQLTSCIPTYQGPKTEIRLIGPNGQELALSLVEVERLLGPTIFLLPGRSGMLVPIRWPFAEHLFSGSPQLPLLPRKHAALFTERAYFRNPNRAKAFEVGAPILFYESKGNKREKGRGCLFAAATITSNRVVWAETISDRALLKGVLDRTELAKRSKNGLISVMHFDNTMILKETVGLARLRALNAVDGANLVAPRCLEMETLSSLFAEAEALAV